MRIVDLSVPTGPGPGEPLPPTIDYEDHERSAPLLAQIFGCEPSDLPDGQGWASETVTLITHAGTHVDAPYHYFPTSGGERARTIDELPLDWFLRPGVRLDVRETPWGERIEVEQLEAALAAAGHTLAPYDIVLLWTGAERAWDTAEYFNAGSGLTRASTTWLLEQGVKVIGTDAWGLDRPFLALRAEFEKTGDASILWEAHRAGIDREYCQIEKLHNLGALPAATGFTVSCLPVKVAGASAGWCRARRSSMRPDPRASPRCSRATASTCSPASRCWCARRRSPRRCCSRCSARSSSARRGRRCARRCRARARATGRRRATSTSTRSRPASRPRRRPPTAC